MNRCEDSALIRVRNSFSVIERTDADSWGNN